MIERHAHTYPEGKIRLIPFQKEFWREFPAPSGWVEGTWPPTQLRYFGEYLAQLQCKTILVETHYIDRDYIYDTATFYARNLRSYPNYCQRLHFFFEAFDEARWRSLLKDANHGEMPKSLKFLEKGYLGFSVVRPLPGSPIGRTVLPTLGSKTDAGFAREFHSIRDYVVHLAGFKLSVSGLAFQQQDQGVSACATTALWSSLHHVASKEHLYIPTPAEITEAAARYSLAGGRSLPQEGLNLQQICEAIRYFGLSPLIVESQPIEQGVEHDKAQLLGYIASGFAPLLAIRPIAAFEGTRRTDGHALCCVGLKMSDQAHQTNENFAFRDTASRLVGLYVHDDRLGPYAFTKLSQYTVKRTSQIRTVLTIAWPDGQPDEEAVLEALVVPLPPKVRLTITRMRALGLSLAQATGQLMPNLGKKVTLNYRYVLAPDYRVAALGFGLSDEGAYALNCETVLSRYLGLLEFAGPNGPLYDVLMDSTETPANPAAIACVCRHGLASKELEIVDSFARKIGARLIR
jgi:hypothetical protein